MGWLLLQQQHQHPEVAAAGTATGPSLVQQHRRGKFLATESMGTALKFFLIVCAASLLFLNSCSATAEGDALATLFREMKYTSYNATINPCIWNPTRIKCDPTSGLITYLDLSVLNLMGPIPPEIGVFTAVTFLSFLNNTAIEGPVPQQLGNLVNLQCLYLSRAHLDEDFPEAVLKLTNLVNLSIDHCGLKNAIPAAISTLTNLEYLFLGNNSLTGPIPSSIGDISNLRVLSLWGNQFYGSRIPLEVGKLAQLEYLNLHDCNLWGALPDELGSLKNLSKLWLYSNSFTSFIPSSWQNMTAMKDLKLWANYLSGEIPLWLPALPSLQSLDLSRNEFSGPVPMFRPSASLLDAYNGNSNLGNLSTFSLACNYFNGTVPNIPPYMNVTGNCFTNSRDNISCSGFTCFKFQSAIVQGCAPCPPSHILQDATTCICTPNTVYGGQSGRIFPLGAVIGGLIGVLALLLVAVALFRYKPFHIFDPFTKKEDYGDWEIPSGVKRYTFLELSKATDNFNEVHAIGVGGFGKVFRGTLDDGKMVAIKRASAQSVQGVLEFRNEVVLLSRLHHRHLVHLEGFCDDKGLQILVYEFMKNGNLHDLLLDESGSKKLCWVRRLEIAVGVAQALDYLHSYADPPVIHRDIKPSNILLDDGLMAKVSDFGISKENQDFFTHISTRPAGTAGYLDPEYFLRRQLTTASDVYAYGVVLLEIITGQQAIDHMRFEELNLIEWVKPRFKNDGVESIVDPSLGKDYDKEVLKVMTEIAIMCAAFSKNDRPSMKEVLRLLEPHLHVLNPVWSSRRLSNNMNESLESSSARLYAKLKSNISLEVERSSHHRHSGSSNHTGSSHCSFDAPMTTLLPR